VTEHSDYKQDSVVSEKINYDLLKLIQEKTENCETLSTATNFNSKTKHDIPLSNMYLEVTTTYMKLCQISL
jgi:galactokinase